MTAPEVAASPVEAHADGARIRIEGLAKEFGPLRVFEGVDLEIGRRECVSIVGPSGCGKTTMLRMIAGHEAPTSGEIAVGQVRDADTQAPPCPAPRRA